jgi:hypothetical protein
MAVTGSTYKEANQGRIFMMKITRKTHNIPSAGRYRVPFLVGSLLVVLVGGLLTLVWHEQHRPIGHAAGDSVVGPPSLPAATVDAIFSSLGSPMAGTGQVVETASRNTNIDDAFALAVWWAETNDGMAGVGLGYHNPGGVQASPNYPRNGYTIYPSYAEAVTDWFSIVQSRYINQGLTSVYTICYPYVGTSGALNWANKVMNYMTSYRASAPPPPTPTPTPTIVPTPTSVPTVAAKPKANTLPQQKAHQQPTAASTKLNVNVTSTQLLLTGGGLAIALLLAVPGLLINRKRQTGGMTGSSVSNLAFEPEQARLSKITTVRMEAISAQQLKSLRANQYLPVLADEEGNTINTSQLAFDVFPTIPASPSFTEPLLEPVASGGVAVPPTPLQRVPATPLLRSIPATPLVPHSSQGGLLTRYNVQSRPRRIALRPTSGTTMPHKIVTHYSEGGVEPQAGPHTETRYQ